MKQTWVLIWKTWRDLRWATFAALLLFLLPSVLQASMEHYRPPQVAQNLIPLFGGFVAVLLAMAVTCRDLSEPAWTFWRSRPIGAARVMLIKYFGGLVALLIATLIPLFFEMCLESLQHKNFYALTGFPGSVAWVHTWTLAALYSISFAIGALVRRAVPAAMLSLAAGLLLYFGPVLVPQLGALETFHWLTFDPPFTYMPPGGALPSGFQSSRVFLCGKALLFVRPEFLTFIVGMLALSTAALVLALVAVSRNLVYRLDQRAIYWSLGLVVLLLLWGASRPLATTLPAASVVTGTEASEYPPFDIFAVGIHGEHAIVNGFVGQPARNHVEVYCWMHPGKNPALSAPLLETQNSVPQSSSLWRGYDSRQQAEIVSATAADGSPRFFAMRQTLRLPPTYDRRRNTTPEDFERAALELLVLDPAKAAVEAVVTVVDVSAYFRFKPGTGSDVPPRLCVVDGRLLLHGFGQDGKASVVVLDISDPDAPHFIAQHNAVKYTFLTLEDSRRNQHVQPRTGETYSIPLPALPELSPRARLEAILAFDMSAHAALDGDILAIKGWAFGETYDLCLFRIVGYATAEAVGGRPAVHAARVQLVSSYRSSLIVRLGGDSAIQLAFSDGILYELNQSMTDGVIAYDVRDPHRIRKLGFYSARDDSALNAIAPLPGRRVLAAGRQLCIIGPVPLP